MSFDSYLPVDIDRMGGLVTAYDRKKLPHGVATVVRNCRYGLNFVGTRWGIARAIDLGEKASINGLGVLVRVGQNPAYIPLVFSDTGNLYQETPVGGGQVTAIKPTVGALPVGAYMEMAATFQRAYLTFGDLQVGLSDPQVYNGGTLDPWSQRPIGETWSSGTVYQRGEIVTPTVPNGHIYRCTKPGAAGLNEPIWPLTGGAAIADGAVQWQEANLVFINQLPAPPAPLLTRNAGAGAFAAARDVYVIVTFNNGNGETTGSAEGAWANTVLNDQIAVPSPVVPNGLGNLGAPYAITGYSVYEADVAHGSPAPLVFQRVAANVAIGTPTVINTTAAGAILPSQNTADASPAGNVCSGLRYGICLFVNRNGNISGITRFAAQTIDLLNQNLQLFAGNIPIGPANVVQRILAFTPAVGEQDEVSISGPYTYIANADSSSGVTILSTVINDNATTQAYLNFTDAALEFSPDVTNRLRAIKLPPQAHCRYIKALHRIATFGEANQPSLVRLSAADDPETFYGDTGYMYITRDDGQRLVTWGEFKDQVYALKERGGFVISTTTQDPVGWEAVPQWEGKGPSGPRAADFGSAFMVFAHRSGGWLYDGTVPVRITEEYEDLWEQINWQAGQTIVVDIDEEEMEIRFSVPIGQATVPNKVITVNFRQGTSPPIFFSHFAGKLIATPESRKASIDDISANSIMRAERPLAQASDNEMELTQILLGSNLDDGIVYMIARNTYNDDGAGIDCYYETAPVGVADLGIPNMINGLARLGGFVASIEGNGKIPVQAVNYAGEVFQFDRLLDLAVNPNLYYRRYANRLSRKWSLGFSNGKQAGSWFQLYDVQVYLKQFMVQESGVQDSR